MTATPSLTASDGVWRDYATECNTQLMDVLAEYLSERFGYKRKYVRQTLSTRRVTLTAYSLRYDLYFRLFPPQRDFWPRECLILARIMFKQERAGHGRALLELLISLAPTFGFKYLAIESANEKASAFAARMGFTAFENGNHWVGSIEDVKRATCNVQDRGTTQPNQALPLSVPPTKQ